MCLDDRDTCQSGLTVAAGVALVVVPVLVVGGVEGRPQVLPALADRRHVAAVAVGRRVAEKSSDTLLCAYQKLLQQPLFATLSALPSSYFDLLVCQVGNS